MTNDEILDLLEEAKRGGAPAELLAEAAKTLGVDNPDLPEVEVDQGRVEEDRAEKFKLLADAAANGAPDELLDEAASVLGLGDNYRAVLEAEAEQAKQAQAVAEQEFQGSSDNVFENIYEGVAQLSSRLNNAAVGVADLATAPARLIGRNHPVGKVAGDFLTEQGILPETVTSVADFFPEGYQPGRGEFVEEREAREAINTLGDGVAMGLGFGRVKRAQGAAAAAAEMAGLGMTDEFAGAGNRAAQINAANRVELDRLNSMSPDARMETLSQIDLDNPNQVQYFANKFNEEAAFEGNYDRLDDLVGQEQFAEDYTKAFNALDGEAKTLDEVLKNEGDARKRAQAERQLAKNEGRREELEAVTATQKKVDAIEKRIQKLQKTAQSDTATVEEVDAANEQIKLLRKEQKKAAKAGPSKVKYRTEEDIKNKKASKLEVKYNPTVEAEKSLTNGLTVVNKMAERFNISTTEAHKALLRSGGLKNSPESFRELMERRTSTMDELFRGGDGSPIGGWEKVWRPATALMRDKVGRQAARDYEQAFEGAARDSELLYRDYVNNPGAAKALSDWMETDAVKRKFLNLHMTGRAGLNELRALAAKEDPKVKEVFERLIKDSEKHRAKMNRVYKKDAKGDAVYWASQKKEAEKSTVDQIAEAFNKPKGKGTKIDATKTRFRGDANELSAEELAQYENPMVAQLARMNEEITAKHLTDRLGLRATLGKNGDMGDLFDEIERMGAAAGSPEKARLMRGIIEDTYTGQKSSPPQWMQTFMKQSYAGTLGQVDSAMMNLHDIAVSAWRNGAKNTGQALWDSLFKADEVNLREMGITNTNNSMGEFREGVGRALENTGSLDKLVDKYQDVAFKYSGFQMMDRMGKGTTMRAALHSFRDAAKKPGFIRDYAHLVKPQEAAQVKKVLADGTKLNEMTPKQQEIVERMMFAKLGEQQLISAAGRPLLYLQVPAARPLWAMTGFAIKQADMLKMAVYDEARNGNWSEAGKAAAGYMAYVAVGYAIVDTVRDLPNYALTGDDKKAPTWDNFVARTFDQPLAAVSLNRLDTQTFNKTMSDPVGEGFKSLAPAGGLLGNALKDAGRGVTGQEFKGYTLKSIPGADVLYDAVN